MLASLPIGTSSWEVMFLFVLWMLGFFWSFSQGTKHLKTAIIAVYVAIAIAPALSFIPSIISLVGGPKHLAYGGAMIFLFVIILFLLSRILRPDSSRSWWKGLVLAALFAGFFVFFLIHQAPAGVLIVSEPLKKVFLGHIQYMAWLVVPLILLLIL